MGPCSGWLLILPPPARVIPDRPRRPALIEENIVQDPGTATSQSGSRRLAGVIFDMDGVLVESEPFIAEAAVRMFAEKGIQVRPEDFRPFIGMGEDRFLGGVAESSGRGARHAARQGPDL